MAESVLVPKFLDIDECQVPLRVSFGRRRDIRFSFTSTGINLMCPYQLSEGAFYEYLDKLRDWGRRQFAEHPRLRERYLPRTYKDGQTIETCFHPFRLRITEGHHKTNAEIAGYDLHIFLQPDLIPFQRKQVFNHLLSKMVGNRLLPDMTRRVNELNALLFKVPIKGVSLRNNQSRWGSCSSKGNLNFSSRLLLAPLEVVDYVIIHELAHRIEMNHSHRFWAEVARAMPDFERHERFLKDEGWSLRF